VSRGEGTLTAEGAAEAAAAAGAGCREWQLLQRTAVGGRSVS
jgi:hypothetical protein